MVWRLTQGMFGLGMFGLGVAGSGLTVKLRPGPARPGAAGRGKSVKARLGTARNVMAVEARLVGVWFGLARQGGQGSLRNGMVSHGGVSMTDQPPLCHDCEYLKIDARMNRRCYSPQLQKLRLSGINAVFERDNTVEEGRSHDAGTGKCGPTALNKKPKVGV